ETAAPLGGVLRELVGSRTLAAQPLLVFLLGILLLLAELVASGGCGLGGAALLNHVALEVTRDDIPTAHQNQNHEPDREKSAGRYLAERIEGEPAQGVGIENVAEPEQVGVRDPECQEPESAAIVDVGAVVPLLEARREQDDAGAEDEREEATHLSFREDVK